MTHDIDEMEELINLLNEGEKPIGKRGRRAVLSRDQVDYIQSEPKSLRALAKELDVSPTTIQRAREHGYRTAAENGAHSYVPNTDRRRLHPDELRAVAESNKPASEVAAEFNISRAYVYILRKKFNGLKPRPPLPHEVIQDIITSELDNDALARRYSISSTIVRLVRRDFGDKT